MIIGGDNYGCLYDDYFIFNTDNNRNNRNNKYDYIGRYEIMIIGTSQQTTLVARFRKAYCFPNEQL